MNRSYIFGQKNAISMFSIKRLPTDRALLCNFHEVFKGESSMTTVLPSPHHPARHARPASGRPAPQQPENPISHRSPTRHLFPTIVSPRKEPPTSSGQIRKLRGEPTEPPKQTLNGRNQPLNGAAHFRPVGQVPDLPSFGFVLHFIVFHHFFVLFPPGGNRQTTIL
jgi:hypothetical protein